MSGLIFSYDAFDSKFLGQPTAKLYINDDFNEQDWEQFDLFIRDQKIKQIFCFCVSSSTVLKRFEEKKFRFVSTKVLYRYDGKRRDAHTVVGYHVVSSEEWGRKLTDQELIKFSEVLWQASHYAKNYKLNSVFTKNIYKQWLINSMQGYAQKVFFVIDTLLSVCVGILTLREKKEGVFIDLLGVYPQYQGKGLGSLLTGEAVDYAYRLNQPLFVWTQGEIIPANRFYQRYGFSIERFELVYHKNVKRR